VIGAIVERVAYANGVLAYESVIRNLLAHRPRSGRAPEQDAVEHALGAAGGTSLTLVDTPT
jgi:hypothetical protein